MCRDEEKLNLRVYSVHAAGADSDGDVDMKGFPLPITGLLHTYFALKLPFETDEAV